MKIGFIGLGNVGAKLAGSLLRNGFDLCVCDVDRDAAQGLLDGGAHWCESGRAMAETCDIVITCLPSPAVSAQVMEEAGGVLEGLSAGKIWLEMSSTDAGEIQRLGKLVEAKGHEEVSRTRSQEILGAVVAAYAIQFRFEPFVLIIGFEGDIRCDVHLAVECTGW